MIRRATDHRTNHYVFSYFIVVSEQVGSLWLVIVSSYEVREYGRISICHHLNNKEGFERLMQFAGL